MRKFLLMCCFLIGITTICRAQGGGKRTNLENMAKQLQVMLKLTDDQTTKITSILKTQATKLDALNTAAKGDRSRMRTAVISIRTSTNDKIKAILTPDQVVAYKKMQDAMQAKVQQGGEGDN